LSNSNTSAAKNDLKDQLNRAADYINEDLKKSRIAEIKDEDMTGDGVTEKVLVLTYFSSIDDTTPKTIRYYLQTASNPWRGPKVLMRIQDSEGDDIGNNTAQVLVDSLTENTITSANFACTGATASTSTAALNSPFTGTGGFQACIKKVNSVNGSPSYSTNIALFGEIKDLTGTNGTSEVLAVDTDTISRSITPSLDAPVISFTSATPTYSLTPSLEWDVVLGAQSYQVYQCSTADPIVDCNPALPSVGTGTLLESNVLGNSPQYTVTTAPPTGQRNCFAVKARNVDSTVESVFLSNTVCTIINPAAAPTAISNLSAVDPADLTKLATETGAFVPALKWTRETSAYQYDVYRCQTTVGASNCTVDTSNSANLVSSFIATSGAEFDENVPWYQATNGTNTTPADNTAFCYAVISKNSQGNSTASDTVCGAINVAKTFKNNWTITWGTLPSGSKPQGVTWTGASGMLYYEVNRCTTTGTTCTPSTDANKVVIDNGTSTTFNETSTPADGFRFCYSIRGSNDTQVGDYSTVQCGTPEPLKCTLNTADFGLGTIKDATKQDSSTETKRLALRAKINFTGTTTFVNLNSSFALQVLSILELGTTDVTNMATGNAALTQPCTQTTKLTWNYPTLVNTPTLTLTSATSKQPVITWTDVSSTNWTNSATYVLRRCQTTGSTCDPATAPGAENVTPTGTRTYNNPANSDKASNNNRYCYAVKAQQLDAITNATYESSWTTAQCGAIQ
jgi:hypothetical protein